VTVRHSILTVVILLVGGACAGCGSTTQTSTSAGTAASAKSASGSSDVPSVASLGVSIPGLLPESYLPKRYTCDGAGISPPVKWNGIPRRTTELVLLVLNAQPVHGHLFIDWAVAGLKPTLPGISAGRLPPGATVGRNSSGSVGWYPPCPEKGRMRPAAYVVKLLALPNRLAVQSGFDATTFYNTAEEVPSRSAGFSVARYRRS
jgi:phosphatidylethanolamine-binding protein (PEBP) family uncharacterized protein